MESNGTLKAENKIQKSPLTTCASSALEDEELMMESVSSSNLMFQSKDSLSLSVQSLTLEVAEPSSEVARHALINGDNDGNKVDPIGSSRYIWSSF